MAFTLNSEKKTLFEKFGKKNLQDNKVSTDNQPLDTMKPIEVVVCCKVTIYPDGRQFPGKAWIQGQARNFNFTKKKEKKEPTVAEAESAGVEEF